MHLWGVQILGAEYRVSVGVEMTAIMVIIAIFNVTIIVDDFLVPKALSTNSHYSQS